MALLAEGGRKPSAARKAMGAPAATMDVRRTVNQHIAKLTDRDTEAMGASHLESMARSLPTEALIPFLSAISDTRPSDTTPLRRHCVRLLSVLSDSHPPHSLTPLLPRMLSAVLRRIRDPDSSVRSACVQAVRSIASAAPDPSLFVRPLLEALLLEQDANAQMAAAMCLSAAIDSTDSQRHHLLQQHLSRLVPRLVKLARADAFRAKPALLSLLGSVVAAGGASSPPSLAILIPCLLEMLNSEDWATRKAAAESLSRVAAISDTHLLATFKSCISSSCEPRRFDKVKIVRETMNQMLQAWKDLPDSLTEAAAASDVAGASPSMNKENTPSFPSVTGGASDSSTPSRKTAKQVSRFPPEAPAAAITPQGNQNVAYPSYENERRGRRRSSPPLFRKFDRNKKPSGLSVEVSAQSMIPKDVGNSVNKESEVVQLGSDLPNKASRTSSEVGGKQQVLCEEQHEEEKQEEEEGEERGSFISISNKFVQNSNRETKELLLIREQLAQIENRQSSLMGLMQRFMESTQNNVYSLEKRVQDLEIGFEELSYNTAMAIRSMSATCWFWRRTEERARFGRRRGGGFVVNPLAEANFQGGAGTLQNVTRPHGASTTVQSTDR